MQTVRSLEIDLLTQLDIPGLLDFYLKNAGHMVSNNYYPPVQEFTSSAAGNTRLSAHPDASLFTVFPFGIDEELELELAGESGESVWQSVDASGSILLYPGYLMEMWTHGAIKAPGESPGATGQRWRSRTIHFFLLFVAVSPAGVRHAGAGHDDQRGLL